MEIRITLIICLSTLILSLAAIGCETRQEGLILEAIEAGADPLEARCAIAETSTGHGVCLLVATKGGE